MDIFQNIAESYNSLRVEHQKLKSALERRDDFIRWLVEVKYEGDDQLIELWDLFEKYEEEQSFEDWLKENWDEIANYDSLNKYTIKDKSSVEEFTLSQLRNHYFKVSNKILK